MNRPIWILDAGAPSPGTLTTIAGEPVASASSGHPLEPRFSIGPGAGGRVLWSGTPGDDPFASDFRVWTDEAWAGLARAIAALRMEVGPDVMLWVRPHACHVVSDLPSCRRFLSDVADASTRVLLDPASMLTEELVGAAEDHLVRILDGLGREPGVGAVLVADVGASGGPVSLGEGVLGAELAASLVRDRARSDMPLVLLEGDRERASALATGGPIG